MSVQLLAQRIEKEKELIAPFTYWQGDLIYHFTEGDGL